MIPGDHVLALTMGAIRAYRERMAVETVDGPNAGWKARAAGQVEAANRLLAGLFTESVMVQAGVVPAAAYDAPYLPDLAPSPQ